MGTPLPQAQCTLPSIWSTLSLTWGILTLLSVHWTKAAVKILLQGSGPQVLEVITFLPKTSRWTKLSSQLHWEAADSQNSFGLKSTIHPWGPLTGAPVDAN